MAASQIKRKFKHGHAFVVVTFEDRFVVHLFLQGGVGVD
jgi:hypothetical protein